MSQSFPSKFEIRWVVLNWLPLISQLLRMPQTSLKTCGLEDSGCCIELASLADAPRPLRSLYSTWLFAELKKSIRAFRETSRFQKYTSRVLLKHSTLDRHFLRVETIFGHVFWVQVFEVCHDCPVPSHESSKYSDAQNFRAQLAVTTGWVDGTFGPCTFRFPAASLFFAVLVRPR